MTQAADFVETLYAALSAQLSDARALRRTIHAHPCLSGNEAPTTRAVLDALPPGTESESAADTGAVARIGGPGPSIAVRAEIDALPLSEENTIAWRSTTQAMHACGHDIHTAAAVALARAVHTLPGATPLVVILQPREEALSSGAVDVLGTGALHRNDVRAVLATHVQPLLEEGTVACTPGVVNASADDFTVTMRGKGGHAAYPHLGADPVLAIAHFIVAVQQLISRETDPMESGVVSIGQVQAGVSANVRPDTATTRGTLRAMTNSHRAVLHKRIESIAQGIAAASGCEVEVRLDLGEPLLNNHAGLAERTRVGLTNRDVKVTTALRSCGADDFAYYSENFPSLMMFVGTGAASGSLHSPRFLPSENAVDHCANALAAGYLAARELFATE